jgi:hypothetical protein
MTPNPVRSEILRKKLLMVAAPLQGILQAMEQRSMEQQATPAPAASSFAGILASLTAPAPQEKSVPAWNNDGLAEDVATISYERALRARTRYLATNASDHSLTGPVPPETIRTRAAFPAAALPTPAAIPAAATPRPAPDSNLDWNLDSDLDSNLDSNLDSSLNSSLDSNAGVQAETVSAPPIAFDSSLDKNPTPDKNLKCASITIRMSEQECAQLRQRAAQAGLTVSAYMRSCTFEAESLRALVKDTLAQLRSAPSVSAPSMTDQDMMGSGRTGSGSAISPRKKKADFRFAPRSWFGWL